MDAIAGWVEREDPGARVVPVLLPAYTDSRTFRAAFPDCVAYGFFPMLHTSLYEILAARACARRAHRRARPRRAARCYREIALELLG